MLVLVLRLVVGECMRLVDSSSGCWLVLLSLLLRVDWRGRRGESVDEMGMQEGRGGKGNGSRWRV